MDYTYTKEKHTKTGEDLWVMRLASSDRLDRSEFNELRAKIKSIGGWWTRFKKGFVFKFDAEEQLEEMFGKNEGSTDSGTSIAPSSKKGIELAKGRVNKNSRYINYIKNNIKSATCYYLGYDEPVPYRDNDEATPEEVKKQLESKDYNYLSYSGNGNFFLSIHSNYNYNFKVEGVTDLIDTTNQGLKSYNFYIPIESKPNWGYDRKENVDTAGSSLHGKSSDIKNEYNVGDKVIYQKFGYLIRGVIEKDKSYTSSVTSYMYGDEKNKNTEVSTNYYYNIKNSSGIIDESLPPNNIMLDDGREIVEFDYVKSNVPNIDYFEKHEAYHPYSFWDHMIKVVGYYKDAVPTGGRARKQSTIESYKKQAEKYKSQAGQLKQNWFNWELSSLANFETSRKVTGETEEEQKQRIELWGKNDNWKVEYPTKKEAVKKETKTKEVSIPDISYMEEGVVAAPRSFAESLILDDAITAFSNHENKVQVLRPIGLYFIVKRINESPVGIPLEYPTEEELRADYQKSIAHAERIAAADKKMKEQEKVKSLGAYKYKKGDEVSFYDAMDNYKVISGNITEKSDKETDGKKEKSYLVKNSKGIWNVFEKVLVPKITSAKKERISSGGYKAFQRLGSPDEHYVVKFIDGKETELKADSNNDAKFNAITWYLSEQKVKEARQEFETLKKEKANELDFEDWVKWLRSTGLGKKYVERSSMFADESEIESGLMKEYYSLRDIKQDNKSLNIIKGKEITLRLPNGEKHKSIFAIVPLSEIKASHNEVNFGNTKDYPLNTDGSNINDRNYAKDKNAQLLVQKYARELEPERMITTSRTPSGSPIIDDKGIVVSGNNRVMSLKLAKSNYPENYQEYKDFLKEEIEAFGLKENDITINDPVLVRIDYDFPAYTTNELAKYNKDTKKAERPIDKVIKLSHILRGNSNCLDSISDIISTAETFTEFYANRSSQKSLLNAFIDCGLITEQEIPLFFNDEFNDAGKTFVEQILASIVLDRDSLIATDTAGIKKIRRGIITALPILIANNNLKQGSLNNELNQAIMFEYNRMTNGLTYAETLRQSKMFSHRNYDYKSVVISRLLDKGVKTFKPAFEAYNNAINNEQAGSLFADVKTPDEIFETVMASKIDSKDLSLIKSSQMVDGIIGQGQKDASQEDIKEAIEVLEMSKEFSDNPNEVEEAIEVLNLLLN